MCYQCHQGLSNKKIKEQLEESIKNPRFELWNSTSISHLNIIESGYNGEENKILAKKLLVNYYSWKYKEK